MKSLSEIAGGKYSLVYFYSSCCKHCGEQLPKLSALKDKLVSNKIEVVGVQYWGNTQLCQINAAKNKLPGNVLLDEKGEICKKLGVGDFTILTLDPKGVILYRGTADDVPAIERSLHISKK